MIKRQLKFKMTFIQDIFRKFLFNYPLGSNDLLKSLNLLLSDRKIILSYNLSVNRCMVYLLFVLIITFTLNEESNSELVSLSLFALNNLKKSSKKTPKKNIIKKKNMRTLLKEQLFIFYKSRAIFSGFIFKNKYVILFLLLLALISFLFNKNLYYFKDLNFYHLNSLIIIIYVVIVYLIYIKFTLMVRLFSLYKSIEFFYTQIKLKRIKDIKFIARYYYSFNIFFIIISILFITHLSYNLIQANIENYVDLSDIVSVTLFLFFFEEITNKEFKVIEKNNINPFLIIFNILLIFFPFFFLNFHSEKV